MTPSPRKVIAGRKKIGACPGPHSEALPPEPPTVVPDTLARDGRAPWTHYIFSMY